MNKKRLGLLAHLETALATALFLFLLYPAHAFSQDLSVSVLDSNGGPFQNVKVYAFTEAGSYTGKSATTSSAGAAVFNSADFSAGRYKFRADYLGQQFWSSPVTLPDISHVDLVIEESNVVVSVYASTGPVQAVKVYLFSESGSYLSVNQQTDGSGNIELDLPAGRKFKFRADFLGNQYWSEVKQIAAGVVNTVPIDLGGGAFVLRVLKAPSAPLTGVKCYVFNEAGSYLGLNQTTDDNGRVTFNLSNGNYKIRIDYLSYQFWTVVYTVPNTLSADRFIAHHDIAITVNGVYQAPTPLEGIKAYLFTSSGSYVGMSQTTDTAGRVIFNLPDKEYRVRADYLGGQYWSDTFIGTDSVVNIPRAEADVMVTGNGQPISGVKVYAFSTAGSYLGVYRTTDAEGMAVFRLPAGAYKFRADYQGNQFWQTTPALTAGQMNPIEISTGGGLFQLTVLKNASNPLIGVQCYVFDESNAYLGLNQTTDESGKVAFGLADGTYKIRIDYLNNQFWTETYTVPQTLSADFIIPHKVVAIDVKGVFDSAQPVEGVKVYLFTSSGSYVGQNLVTNGTGQVKFYLPNRQFKVRVDYMGGQYWSNIFAQTDAAVNIPMAKAEVTVTGANRVIEGVEVYVFSASGSYLGLNAATDASGKTSFMVPAGSFKFRGDYLSNQYWSSEAVLIAAQTNPVEIPTGGGLFRLTLLKGPSLPIAGVKCYVFTQSGYYIGLNQTTDAAGGVSFNLSDGEFKIRIDYLLNQIWTDVYDVPDVLTVEKTIPHQNITVTVNGIYETKSRPVIGNTVYLFTASGSYTQISSVTNEKGRAVFNLPELGFKARTAYQNTQFWSGSFTAQDVAIEIPLTAGDIPPTILGLAARIAGSAVELTWTSLLQQSTPPLAGYNIYRSVSGSTDPAVKVNDARIPLATKLFSDDSDFQSGAYSYYIVAISNYGIEGDPSEPAIVSISGDCDLDGISDADESGVYGTNYLVADTDGDGIDDGAELTYWNEHGGWNTDFDGDGLNNLKDPDSDNDRVGDKVEIDESHTDPSSASSRPSILPGAMKLNVVSNTDDGSTVFTDISPAAHAITAFGGIHHGDAAKFCNNTAIVYDGIDDCLSFGSSPDWNFGAGDFTIDLWANFSSVPDENDGIFSTLSGSSGYVLAIIGGKFQWYQSGTNWMDTGVTPVKARWYHLAVVRAGNTLTIYVDGIAKVNKACAGISINSAGGFVAGRYYLASNLAYFGGHMDEITISKGFARWTADFTPPNHPCPNGDYDLDGISDADETGVYGTNYLVADTDGDGIADLAELNYWGTNWNMDFDGDGLNNLKDPDSDNDRVGDKVEIDESHTDPSSASSRPSLLLSATKLYVYSEASDGDTTFTDSSWAGHTITAVGDVHHGDAAKFCNNTAIVYDGVDDCLSFGSSPDWDFGAGDFTIDLWANFSSVPDENDGIFSTLSGSSGYVLAIIGGKFQWYQSGTNWMDTGVTPVKARWYHLAVVRAGNTLTIYVDGIAKVNKACAGISINSAGGFVAGRYYLASNLAYFGGHMDEITISKGFARWTADFTPPNHPCPNGDYDLDGISDADESGVYGTNYLVADTDGDGIDDGAELTYWNEHGGWNTDFDGDGLNNLKDPDSDNDRVGDKVEIDESHTDPSSASSRPSILPGAMKLNVVSNTDDGSTVFTDISPAAHAITAFGGIHHGDAAKFCNNTAIVYDGIDDCLSFGSSPDWNFGAGDFTIDLWANFSSVPDENDGIFSTLSGSSGYVLAIIGGKFQWYQSGTNWMDTGVTPVKARWYHLAVVRAGNTLTIYVDGIAKVNKACAGISINSAGGFVAGRYYLASNLAYFGGHMDEITISKGFARWTADFTPPNRPCSEGETPPQVSNFSVIVSGNQVQISWTPTLGQTTPPVIGYNIYRSTSDETTPPVKINPELIPVETSTWADSTIPEPGIYSYYMKAVSSFGYEGEPSQTVTVVTLVPPPVIITQPENTTVSEGSDAQFTVVATGTNLTYQWQRFSANIEGATQATLTVPDVSSSDNNAVFRCIVSNAAGSVTSATATLTVNDTASPVLTINGPAQINTTGEFQTITGTATDTGAGMASVSIVSDKYPGQQFSAILQSTGAFSCEAPVRAGVNTLTITAKDKSNNQSTAQVVVTVGLTTLPVITITSPQNGTTVTQNSVTFAGMVRSSLPADQIRLVFNNAVSFPAGANGEYHFEYSDVPLAAGPNTLTLTAETAYGNVSAQTTVSYKTDTPEEESPPVIEIDSYQPQIYVNGDTIVVNGTAKSDAGIARVTVNGETVDFTGSDIYASFDHRLLFPQTGEEQMNIVVVVTDGHGNTSTVSYIVFHDATPPVISFDLQDLAAWPTVNPVFKTPYHLSGTVIEASPTGLLINNQSVTLLPGATANEWLFSADMALTRATDSLITLLARDKAGNQTSREVILRLNATLAIEVISPKPGASVTASGGSANVTLDVLTRIPGISPDDKVYISADNTQYAALTPAGSTASGAVSIPAVNGGHELEISVKNTAGDLLAETSVPFSIVNLDSLPLSLTRQEPENDENNVNPNAFIALYFNRAIDPGLLSVQVQETAHGLIYEDVESGADLTDLSDIKLIEVHRDHEPVPGGLSFFPENTLAAFYPGRNFAYNGTVYVNVVYNGEEISRFSFNIRPLPTFIQGFVSDNGGVPVEGLTVSLEGLNRETKTSSEGSFGFGFGEKAADAILPGRYRLIVNPGLSNLSFGTVERWIVVEAGKLNTSGIIPVPVIDPQIPFEHVASGADAVLANSGLTLDMNSDTRLRFPTGAEEGNVHVQFLELHEVPYTPISCASPQWMYNIQPGGIEITGSLNVSLLLPSLYGNYDYLESMNELVLLVGLDPNSLSIVPVGVGRLDKATHKLTSEGKLSLKRLDYIGYSLSANCEQELLDNYLQDKVSLNELIGILENK